MAFNSQPMNMGPMTQAKDHLPDPQRQMGSYLLQPSTGAIPANIPANFWMLSDGSSQLLGGRGESLWRLPSSGNQEDALYRGQSSGGLRLSNLPAPLTLLPGKPMGPSGGGGGSLNEGQLNVYGGAQGAGPDTGVS